MKTLSLKSLYRLHEGFVSDKWESCLEVYEEKFKEFKFQRINLLEIGVQNGGSLEIWDKYFPNAQLILGCDINPLCGSLKFSSDKVKVIVADASDLKIRDQVLNYASSFDIIIDDGSHKDRDVISSFLIFFPLLRENGLYAVEDLHCSYWRTYTFKPGKFSQMEFFKLILDVLNYEFWDEFYYKNHKKNVLKLLASLSIDFPYEELIKLAKGIYSMEFYNSLLIIRKRNNSQGLGRRVIAGRKAYVDDTVLKYR